MLYLCQVLSGILRRKMHKFLKVTSNNITAKIASNFIDQFLRGALIRIQKTNFKNNIIAFYWSYEILHIFCLKYLPCTHINQLHRRIFYKSVRYLLNLRNLIYVNEDKSVRNHAICYRNHLFLIFNQSVLYILLSNKFLYTPLK